MVAIYVPSLQASSPNTTTYPAQTSTSTTLTNNKIAFFLRALHAYNKAKHNRLTCLGTAVTCNRRCRNPLYESKWAVVLDEMIEAAENRNLCLADLKGEAAQWAKGLACYLHGGQKGVAMGVLGAIALYRKMLDACVIPIVGMCMIAPFDELARQHYDRAKGCLGSAVKDEEVKESGSVDEELAAQVKLEEEQLRVIQEKEMALFLANEKRIALLEERVLLLLERLELLLELDKVKAMKEALKAGLEGGEQ